MASQVMFFNKNKIDLDNPNASITVTDGTATNTGQSFVDYVRNRNNTSAWLTTGSNDAANTQLDIDMIDERDISDIFLIGHNFKAFTIKYWNGSSYVDFSTAISETTNAVDFNHYSFTEVATSKIRIIITGTQAVDDDKVLKQLIFTNKVLTGQLTGWPEIKNTRHSTNKKISTMLSGKISVVESIGSFECNLSVKNWSSDADLSIVEEIYFGKRAVLVWLSGGDEAQFSSSRIGYRKEDIYLMRAIDDYRPDFVSGLYVSGLKIDLRLKEAIS
ncbi:MAG: hypothetical protein KDD61_09125 [Bdellovibrionales bacterium]|nr:hypothetical protein [Bdellovibrionales bacterium]